MPEPVSSRGRSRLLRLLVLVATCALAAACGSSGSPTPAPSGQSTVLAPETATPQPELASTGPTQATGATPAATTPAPAATTPAPTSAATGPVKIELPVVLKGLPHPIGIANAGDSRLFIVDQVGKILIVDGGRVTGTFLDIHARVNFNNSERGLLGLAFHPQYASNGLFYVRYNIGNGDVRVSEFRVGSDPAKADPSSERVLLTISHHQFTNHNGGVIAFGHDGYLYIGTGDGGSGGDPNRNGQNLNTLSAKLLRIDVDHTSTGLPYAIPADNPFAGQSGKRGEIWAYGLRNPYSFSFDRATGDLWLPDVGQNKYEEINRATWADGLGRGANYGWNVMEANHCYKPSSGCKTTGMARPMAEYSHGASDKTGCAVIGGAVYRGTAHADLTGRYFFGDYCSGRIWTLDAAGPDVQTPRQVLDTTISITGWGEGADGEIYLVSRPGYLYHLV